MKIKTFAPATIANFIIGFDTLGAALNSIDGELFGDIVTVEANKEFNIEVKGKYAYQLPIESKKNIIYSCFEIFQKNSLTNTQTEKCIIHLEKRLPVSSGLGSSATSIVATLIALNTFYGDVFTKKELLILAGEMEGKISGSVHYDNAAPSLLGGLQLMVADKQRISEVLPFFDEWFFIIYYPGIAISTRHARMLLPKQFDIQEITAYWQKLAGLIHGLYRKDKELVTSLLNDPMIEPFRSQLVPGFENARKAALSTGALAFGLSGSGPSFFAISESLEKAQQIEAAIKYAMPVNQNAFSKICNLDKQGARSIDPMEN